MSNPYLEDLLHGLDTYTRSSTPSGKLEALAELRRTIKLAEMEVTRTIRIRDLDDDDDY